MMSAMSRTSVASDVRSRVRRSRDRFWTPADFDGSPEAVAKALSRLSESGELRRIRRGLYWRGSSTRLGMAPPRADSLADAIVGEAGMGPAGVSAALSLGLSTQVPRVETVAVPRRAPRPTPGVRFVSRAGSTRRRDERLNAVEVALLEVLRDWDRTVEASPAVAVDRVRSLSETGAIRLERVVRASWTEPASVRERLRALLRALDKPGDADRVPPARSNHPANLSLAS
jgi:hypothetical protein